MPMGAPLRRDEMECISYIASRGGLFDVGVVSDWFGRSNRSSVYAQVSRWEDRGICQRIAKAPTKTNGWLVYRLKPTLTHRESGEWVGMPRRIQTVLDRLTVTRYFASRRRVYRLLRRSERLPFLRAINVDLRLVPRRTGNGAVEGGFVYDEIAFDDAGMAWIVHVANPSPDGVDGFREGTISRWLPACRTSAKLGFLTIVRGFPAPEWYKAFPLGGEPREGGEVIPVRIDGYSCGERYSLCADSDAKRGVKFLSNIPSISPPAPRCNALK